ncbi:hypothetical protein CFter6_0462 [Collimonas fungivorans]|uniref:Uncharacterized protein n=1 Tax=Collimonas fungivorans TaxID=158899 RepID=A0A127P603_9BURK|nr:hypothetical protein CFter6_0462 [Collimonas fungivorans]
MEINSILMDMIFLCGPVFLIYLRELQLNTLKNVQFRGAKNVSKCGNFSQVILDYM